MSFLEHLEELRWHIIRSVMAIVFFMVIAFVFKTFLFDKIILAPKSDTFFTNRMLCRFGQEILNTSRLCINSQHLDLISIKMAGQLTTHIAVSMVAGVILAFPIFLWEFWRFFKPALKPNEAMHARGAVFAASLLFFTGVLFGYYLLSPLSMHFLGTYEVSAEVSNQINVRSYIGTLSSICLATGVVFELPIIAYFLTKIGLITPDFMRRYRKHSLIVIFILSAIITPPDVISQLLVSLPLIGLYEVGIVVSGRVLKKQKKDLDDFMNDGDSSGDKTTT